MRSGRPVERPWLDEFAHRLEHTPFHAGSRTSGSLAYPAQYAKCLNRQMHLDVCAGSSNPKISNPLRAQFLEAVADYELLVSLDPLARNYLAKASIVSPDDTKLSRKLKSLDSEATAEPKH